MLGSLVIRNFVLLLDEASSSFVCRNIGMLTKHLSFQFTKACLSASEELNFRLFALWQVILTILTHLELGEVQYLSVLPQINATCTLNFHQVGWKLGLTIPSLSA